VQHSPKALRIKTLQRASDVSSAQLRRSRAFPISELKINCVIQALACAGVTVWQVNEPGQVWPWFLLGWGCFASLAVAMLQPQTGTPLSSLAYALVLGAPLAWAGWHVQSLGYVVLGWAGFAIAPIFVAYAIGQGIYMLATLRERGGRD